MCEPSEISRPSRIDRVILRHVFVSAKEQVFVHELVVGERCLNLRIDPTHRRKVSVSGIDDPRSANQSVPEIVVTSANGMGGAASVISNPGRPGPRPSVSTKGVIT